MKPTSIPFIHALTIADIPPKAVHQAKRLLLDTLGVAAAAHSLPVSGIAREFAAVEMAGNSRMLLDSRTASHPGAAFAGSAMVDCLDFHDGHDAAIGHTAASLIPALLLFADRYDASATDLLVAIVIGYEVGIRAAEAQHASVPDYHSSGSWTAVAVAAGGARLARLSETQTAHALGIAEYYGPRSLRMRVIENPTMVQDGAASGAMNGTLAVQLAARGFTGAPSTLCDASSARFADLDSTRWAILEQYFKPFPTCRWTHAAVRAVLQLREKHGLCSRDVRSIRVETSLDASRLSTVWPRDSEQAMFSMPFVTALAMVRGEVSVADVCGDAWDDAETRRLAEGMAVDEHPFANDQLPLYLVARVTLKLETGGEVMSDWLRPTWSHEDPPSDSELSAKFQNLAEQPLGRERSVAIESAVWSLDSGHLTSLTELLFKDP